VAGSEGEFEGVKAAWAHLATDEGRTSLNQTGVVEVGVRDGSKLTGINHVGFVGYDLKTLRGEYEAAGGKCSFMEEVPARMRMHVTDHDGIVWEFIPYLSDDPAIQNDNSV
jgi:hypothetical protein